MAELFTMKFKLVYVPLKRFLHFKLTTNTTNLRNERNNNHHELVLKPHRG